MTFSAFKYKNIFVGDYFSDPQEKCTINLCVDTLQIFNDCGFLLKNKQGKRNLDIYYIAALNGFGSEIPGPQMMKNQELFFYIEGREISEKGKIFLYDTKNNSSNTPIKIDVRNTKSSFEFKNNLFKSFETLILKTFSGTTLSEEYVFPVAIESGNKLISKSFDFTNYPFSIYSVEIKGYPDTKLIFAVDKYGELGCKYAIIRILNE
jgi:hypothetical protein